MYVAITRARKRLYLSHAQSRILHGQTRYNLRSRFFDELPEETLKWLSPKAGKPASSYAPSLGSAWSDEAAVPFTPSAASLPVAGHGLRVGQSVFHTKFGEGVILTLEGQSLDARAQVQFKRHGLKWLALNIAKLTPVN